MAAHGSDLAVPKHAVPDEQDQRRHPRILPACERCAHSSTAIALRTDYVVYIRCARCAWVWPIPILSSDSPIPVRDPLCYR